MMSKILASVVLSSMLVSVLAEVPTVKDLKLGSYSGKWYQIADYPLFYENFCGKCTEASYTPNADGSISVQNDAQSVFGRIGICSTAGTATIPDPAQPAKLKVKLDSGFGRVADYWVVEVGPEENGKYSWSIVTNAQQSSLFILFRTRTPDGALYSAVIEKVKGYGFDLSKIKKTPQTNCDDASSL